jgi:hypothetical protein
VWYLKQHGWIEVLDTGQYAITVAGIDKIGGRELSLPADRLLGTGQAVSRDQAGAPRLEGTPVGD